MLYVHVEYVLKDGIKGKDFYNRILKEEIISKTHAEEGCLRFEYFFPAETEGLFLLEKWKDHEALEFHKNSSYVLELQELKKEYVFETKIETIEV